MDALFVGFLTTYSHTYSAAQKMLAAYYARRYITSIAATHRSDMVSGSAVTSERFIKNHFPADQLVPACHQLAALE